MTSVMNPPGLGLEVPSSRQDVISALLNDYADSFGQNDADYGPMPIPALKELPPPPPSSSEKPLPSALSMRFQLREDEVSNKNSIESPTKIVSRSITRGSKPPSLKLLASNGSTALVPKSPAQKTPTKDRLLAAAKKAQQSFHDRPLPPPPPEKSIRRKSLPKSGGTMGQVASRPDRRDSKDPETTVAAKDGPKDSPQSRSSQTSQSTKRKPLPGSSLVKKFPSLADLKSVPRGRKPSMPSVERDSVSSKKSNEDSWHTGTPASQAAAYRKASLSQPSTDESTSRKASSIDRPDPSKSQLSFELVPAPQEPLEETIARAPPPPRKAYVGLPSNPRAKAQEPTVTHIRGKSSTGFDVIKSAKPAPVVTQTTVNTITPRPTPPPNDAIPERETPGEEEQQTHQEPGSLASTVQAALKAPESPVSPLSDYGDALSDRPFSFEAPPPQIVVRKPTLQQLPRQQESEPQQEYHIPPRQSSTAAPAATLHGPFSPGIPAPTPPPPDATLNGPFSPGIGATCPADDLPSPTAPAPTTTTSQFPPRTSSRPAAQSPQPPQQTQHASSSSFPLANTADASDPDSTFVPLTRQPVPLTPRPITEHQLSCYTHHAIFSEYLSRFQRTGCSVCGQSELGLKATCAWCLLQVCKGCRDDLCRVPGRELRVLLERRGNRDVGRVVDREEGVIWEEDGE